MAARSGCVGRITWVNDAWDSSGHMNTQMRWISITKGSVRITLPSARVMCPTMESAGG